MAIDYTKLLAKLQPDPGGEDILRLRTGVVSAFNGNGTVDLLLSGVTVEDVPYLLTGGAIGVGAVVQVISYRGALLVLGPSGSTNQPAATLYDEVTSDQTTTSATGVAYMSVELPAAGSYVFDILWIISNSGVGTTGTPGFALGGTATPTSWTWASQGTPAVTTNGVGGARSIGTTTYPTNVESVTSTAWTDTTGGNGAVQIKGRVTVSAAGRLDFRIGRQAGTGTITTRRSSSVTVTPIG